MFQWRPQAIVFGIVTNKKFDMIIMMFIGLNMLTMTLDHYGQNDMWVFALENLNMGFICIFTTESVLKIFALRQHYFTEPWNIFDFVVVILSILGNLLDTGDVYGGLVGDEANVETMDNIEVDVDKIL